MLTLVSALLLAGSADLLAAGRNRSSTGGGGGGGGGVSTPKVVESRVTGYITAIDHVQGTVVIGASYYGSGSLRVTSSTKISLNNFNCDFEQLRLGDWVEARYLFATKEATKLEVTRP